MTDENQPGHGVGRFCGRPVDGASARDLRGEADARYRARSSPASCAAHNPDPCQGAPGWVTDENHPGHGVGRFCGRPVDGAWARDLRGEADARYQDAQLTGLVPRPQS